MTIGNRLLGDRGDGSRRGLLLCGLVFAVAMMLPMVASGTLVDVVSNALIYVLLALGLNVILGYTGLLNLGFAAFFAMGAYVYGISASPQVQPTWMPLFEPLQALGLVSHIVDPLGGPGVALLHFDFWLMLGVGAVVAGLLGLLFGAPAIRLRGDYYAVVTLGLAEMVPIIIRNSQDVTGGAGGLSGVRTPSVLGRDFGLDPVPYFYLLMGLVFIGVFLSFRLEHSRVGRSWRAIREDELAARSLGVNEARLKLLASAIGAAFGGIAGVVWMSKTMTAAPTDFTFNLSMAIVMIVVLGGAGNILGVVAAAILISLTQSVVLPGVESAINAVGEALSIPALASLQLTTAIPLLFGIVLVAVIIYRPRGIFPSIIGVRQLSRDDRRVDPDVRIDIEIERIGERPSAPGPILRVDALSKHFGGLRAVDGVSLSVSAGEILGVIGPNGAGKTTLFNLLTGLETPSSGKVEFLGHPIAGLTADAIAHRGLLRTFQNGRSFPTMTVLENVLVGQERLLKQGALPSVLRTRAARTEEQEAREWALELLGIFGNRLMPRVDHPASSLSYANRRRLEIARALAARPRLLLLDEPTAGMNPAETIELMEQMRQLPSLGVSLIIIEHKLHVVTELCSHVVVLNFGQKIAEGPPEVISADPAVLEAYLGTRPSGAALAPAGI